MRQWFVDETEFANRGNQLANWQTQWPPWSVRRTKTQKASEPFPGHVCESFFRLPVFGLAVWLLTKGQKRDRSYEYPDSSIRPY